MRLAGITAALHVLVAVQAFVIPPGTAEGVYAVTTRSDGVVEYIKLDAASKPSPTEYNVDAKEGSMERRQITLDPPTTSPTQPPENRVWCGCGYNMDHGNCDSAVSDLKKQLKPAFVNAGTAYFAIRNNVVAFACYRDQTPNTAFLMFSSVYTDALTRISSACGNYVAGSINVGPSDKQMIVGYQRYKAGDDFCTSATGSKSSKC